MKNYEKPCKNLRKTNKKMILNPIQAYANAMTVIELRAELKYHEKSKKINKEQLVKEMTHMLMNKKNAIYQKPKIKRRKLTHIKKNNKTKKTHKEEQKHSNHQKNKLPPIGKIYLVKYKIEDCGSKWFEGKVSHISGNYVTLEFDAFHGKEKYDIFDWPIDYIELSIAKKIREKTKRN